MKKTAKVTPKVDRPLVTIGVLTYKRPHLLPRVLESVAQQIYQPIEVIVCDNATPGDENEKVIAAFKDKIPELRYLKHATNLGDIKSYYHLLEEAQGSFFMWLADDDEISPGFVEASVEALEEHPNVPFSNAYCQILSDTGQYAEYQLYPEGYMDENWFRRILVYSLVKGFCNEPLMEKYSFLYTVHRTAPLRDALAASAKNLPYWSFNKECGSLDNLLLFEMVLQGKMLPVTRKDAVWICHIDSEKCYYIGTEATNLATRVKKLFEFMMFGINVYSIYIKRIYNRGGFFYAFIYILLLIPLALYMLCILLRLHPQEGRWGLPYRKAP